MVPNAIWIGIPTKVAYLPGSIYTIDFCRVNHNSLLTFHYAEHKTNGKTSGEVRSEVDCRVYYSKKDEMETIYEGWVGKTDLRKGNKEQNSTHCANFLSVGYCQNFIYISPYFTLHLNWADLDIHRVLLFFLLEYNFFTMCYFLLYNTAVISLGVYPFPPWASFSPPSRPSSRQEHWAEFPCAIEQLPQLFYPQ